MSLVVVQRGHVPRTSGSTGAPGEQQFAIDTAALLAPMLRSMGHTVRVIDADEPRSRYAGNVFVSIHYDSSGSSSASGASVGYQNSHGQRFAQAWKSAYADAGWTRGFRPDNYTANLSQYYGVREAIAAGNLFAIITESGFQTNAQDRAMMTPELTARSIAVAVGEITDTQPPEEDAMTAKEVWNFRDTSEDSRAWQLLESTFRTVNKMKDTVAAIDSQVSAIKTALSAHDANLGEKIQAALADAVVQVDVDVHTPEGQA